MSWASKQIITQTMQVWAANQALRDRLGAAGATADAAGNAAGSTVYAINGDAALWGKAIPITWGRRRITGQMLQMGIQRQQTIVKETQINPEWYAIYGDAAVTGNRHGWAVQSNVQIQSETKFYSTFAYCFGAPGNREATQILKKLWFNGQLVYDIDQGQLSTEIRFKLYQGDEFQLPDEELNRIRYSQPVAYRGLIYIVFYDYSINGQTVSGNPLVEAEFAEQVTNSNALVGYTKSITIPSDFWYPMLDARKGIVYIFGEDVKIYKFRVSDRMFLGATPITGLTNESSHFFAAARVLGNFRIGTTLFGIFQRAASNAQRVFVVNLDTGVITDWHGNNNSALTPSLNNIMQLNNYSPLVQNGLEGSVAWILAISIFGDHFLFKVDINGQLTNVEWGTIGSNGANGILLPTNTSKPVMAYWYQKNLYFDGVLYKTFATNIRALWYSPLDNTIVAWCQDTLGDWSFHKVARDDASDVKWSRYQADYPLITVVPDSLNWKMNSYTAGQRIGWSTGTRLHMLDLISGELSSIPSSSAVGLGTGLFDAFTNRIILSTGNETAGTTNISDYPFYNYTTGNMLLSTFLRNIAQMQGYETGNITIENIPDQIVGAAITQVTDLDSMLDDVRRCYNFQIIKSGNKIRFTRKGYGNSLVVDATYTEDQRAILSDSDSVYVTVETETVAPTQSPGTVIVSYIDPDYNFTVVPFSYKRNDPLADRSVELKLNLPIIMSGSDAAALAARALIDSNLGGTTHKFRLPQANLAHEPGDIVTLVFDDYTDTVRIVEISYNGDFSLSIDAESMYTEDGPAYPVPVPILPEIPPSLLSGEGMALIMDTTLIRASDQVNANVLEIYASVVAAGRLPVTGVSVISQGVDGGQLRPVATTGSSPTYGLLITALSAGPVLQVNYDEVIQFQLAQGDSSDFQTDTLENMLAGKNRALIGVTGRWEQIGYIAASYDSNTFTMTLTGIVRGWRGTEVFAPLHVIGDYVIPITSDEPNILTNDVVDLNKIATYAVADGNARVNYDDAVSLPILGASRRPWAPYNVHVINAAGDLTITWKRRTRLTGPLNNGNSIVPLDETDEEYQLLLYRAGSIVRTLPALTSPTFTYTAAMQAEDGWTGSITQLQLNVSQISELVGPGFANAGTYDVE